MICYFYVMLELNNIYNIDCIEGMKQIDDKSIDMICCDLPYGTGFELNEEYFNKSIKRIDEIKSNVKLW